MRIPFWIAAPALVLVPLVAVAYVRVMTRASERFRDHMAGAMIMVMLNGVGLGTFVVVWFFAYRDVVEASGGSRSWLLLPLGLVLVAAVVYRLMLGRRLGKAPNARVDSAEAEPATPDRHTLAKDLRHQLRYTEQSERRAEADIRRLEAELALTEQAQDGPAKRVATETLTRRLAWQREDLEWQQRRKLELHARLAMIEDEPSEGGKLV